MTDFVADNLSYSHGREAARVLVYDSHNILIQRGITPNDNSVLQVRGLLENQEHVGDRISKRLESGDWDPHTGEYDHFIGISLHEYEGPDPLEEISPATEEDVSIRGIKEVLPYNFEHGMKFIVETG